MGARRRGVGPSPSFFSFQDIMMCCLGIMMLIATVAALLMTTQAGSVPSAEMGTDAAPMDTDLAAEVAQLEERLREAVQLQNRDLDGEAAELRAELEANQQDLKQSVERLKRVIAQAQRTREQVRDDPAAERVARLLERRDSLRQSLEEVESRRRLAFRKGEGADRTRVFEVSSTRIVEAPALGDGLAMVHAVQSADQGAEVLLRRMSVAEAQGLTSMIALKPSGFAVHEAYKAIRLRERDAGPPRGLELIPEDRWISDQFPNWPEANDGR